MSIGNIGSLAGIEALLNSPNADKLSLTMILINLEFNLAKVQKDSAYARMEEIAAAQDQVKLYQEGVNLARAAQSFDAAKLGLLPTSAEATQEQLTKLQSVIDTLKQGGSITQEDLQWVNALGGSAFAQISADNPDLLTNLEARATGLEAFSFFFSNPEITENAKLQLNTEMQPERWQTVISNLQEVQDTIGTDTQQQMIYVQEGIGQYNAYIEGISTLISKANDSLKQIVNNF